MGRELWSPETRRPTTVFGLDMEREQHYERAGARSEAIVAAGAREEVVRAQEADRLSKAAFPRPFESLTGFDAYR